MTALSTPTEKYGFGDSLGPTTMPWPPGLSIRPRRADDSGALSDLFAQRDFQRNASTLDPFEQPDDAHALLDRAGPGVFEMVATLQQPRLSTRGDESENTSALLIGFAGLYAFAGRQRHVGCCTLAVHEAFQKRGAGTALLQALLRSAYDYVGLERVQLTVFTDNVRAISLYRQAGFRTEGRLKGFARREDVLVDAFLLAHDASCGGRSDARRDDSCIAASDASETLGQDVERRVS